MPKKIPGRVMPRPVLTKLLKELASPHLPARVVTTGGIAPRGDSAVWKCETPKYQSLVEEDCQRVVDIASCITTFETHPVKLDLGSEEGPLHYTPDLLLWSGEWGAVVEVKPEEKLASNRTATRLRKVIARLRRHGIPLCLMLDTDARADGLQTTLKLLQRDRPVRGRYQADIDATMWDPHGRMPASAEQLARWQHAQRICDDLLRRVMRRNPDDLLTVA